MWPPFELLYFGGGNLTAVELPDNEEWVWWEVVYAVTTQSQTLGTTCASVGIG